MNFFKGTLAVALTGLLTACGGGGSDGYYNNGGGSNTPTQPPTGGNTTTAETQKIFDSLKTEAAAFIWGQGGAVGQPPGQQFPRRKVHGTAVGKPQLRDAQPAAQRRQPADPPRHHCTGNHPCLR